MIKDRAPKSLAIETRLVRAQNDSALMIVTTAQLYKIAYGKYAIGAYNINNLEQTMGLFRGCLESRAPFIIQLSKGARKYADKRMLEAIIRTAEVIFPRGHLRRPPRPRRRGILLRLHRQRLLFVGDDRRQPRAL